MKRVQLAWLSLLSVACRTAAPSPPAPSSSMEQSPAERSLDGLDARAPVPLLPMMALHQKENMRDHLLAVQEIVGAAAVRDFLAVEAAARRIGYSDAMADRCNHMGSAAPGFARAALQFHQAADDIGRAARARDAEATLAALSKTLTHCTSCHATYKQRVVDEQTWSALGSAPGH